MRPLDRLRSGFQGSRERDELRDLYDRLRLHADEAGDRLLDLAAGAAERAVADAGAEEAPLALRRPVLTLAYDLLVEEGAFVVPETDLDRLDLAEIWKLKSLLRRQLAFYEQPDRVDHLGLAVAALLSLLLEALPSGAPTGDDDEETGLGLTVPLHALLRDPGHVLDGLLAITLDEELEAAGHLETLRAQLAHNLYRASGIDPERAQESRRQLVWPGQAKDKSSEALVAGYLAGTPLAACLATPVPFQIPFAARFEHTHILGGTGHGKTQLLQHLILRDLAALQEGKGSLVVIDSQGDMIRTILQLAELAPGREGGLADRLVLIDPNDIEHPPALNLFDVGLERLDRYAPLEREKLINGAIALYAYMFGALLGAELTQRQGVIFRYLARLMLVVPGATIHTLRGFMEEPETVRDHLGGLEPMARHFFERQFLSSAFDDTRQQILTRLWGVLANPVLARMLSHERNRLDLFQALNRGSLILINTAKDLLKQEGCEILGRFFIALIAQATQERAGIPADRRRATFVYIDEAQDYFDESVEQLLNQARKFKVGLVLAHQNLGQLGRELQASIMASTAIKIAGGVSAHDATALAKEMRSDPGLLQAMRKHRDHTEFACWIRNATPQPLSLAVPFGEMERRPCMGEGEQAELLERNRARYCAAAGDEAEAWGRAAAQPRQGGFEIGAHEIL